jgi:hypothetical protein
MTTNDKFNQKLNEQWEELSKRFADFGNVASKEALNVASDVLKTLSKEFAVLGEQMDRWASTAKKKAGEPESTESPGSPENKDGGQPPTV